nr:cytochrome c1 [Legionella spiritensis]
MCMKRLLIFLAGLLLASLSYASIGNETPLQSVNIDLHNKAKLQRGAKIFMNYCSGCHSLKYLRYNRMAKDLGVTTFDGEVDQDLLFNNLVFTKSKIVDPIQISMPPEDAIQWFGVVPPDLSLTARVRGAPWIYTYLKSFYADPSRPFGANNLLIPDVAMPNVLEPLIGHVIAINKKDKQHDEGISHLVLVERGRMNQHEFDSAMEDLVNFLVYVAEPVKLVRYRIGIGVLIFLGIFLIVAYQLKKTYWRRLH